MRDIVIYGTGGFGREVLELIKDINSSEQVWNVLGFIDDNIENHGTVINGYLVLGGYAWLENYKNYNSPLSINIAIGNPQVRKRIAKKLNNELFEFPNLVHPSVISSQYVLMGKGNTICANNILTTNIKIGNFVTINLACTVGHDVIIGDFTTLLPACNVSGSVKIETCVDIGTKTCIIPNVTIGENSVIGAGATVIRDIPQNCTAVGSPAKPIKFHHQNSDEVHSINR
ncbi:acetyltransferase [Bacillus sp. JJ1122]|uniref:acetyltransferase n=1 Tax=Bacillus sp. JJ1122 TaxID=3122951 RepID=UPI002FFF9969